MEAHPSFAFIEAIKPVRDAAVISRLDAMLDEGLRGKTEVPLALAVPVDLAAKLDETVSYNIKIGSGWVHSRTDRPAHQHGLLDDPAPVAEGRAREGLQPAGPARAGTGVVPVPGPQILVRAFLVSETGTASMHRCSVTAW